MSLASRRSSLTAALAAAMALAAGCTQETQNQLRRDIQNSRDAFPDLDTEILQSVEQGDMVAIRWQSHGTHTGSCQQSPSAAPGGSGGQGGQLFAVPGLRRRLPRQLVRVQRGPHARPRFRTGDLGLLLAVLD